MQAHKLSSYNTQPSNSNISSQARGCAERKVELVKGKPMLTAMVSQSMQNKAIDKVASGDVEGHFDFAGLAG